MLKIIMLRHFTTVGNLQKKYIGITDEPLCKESISTLKDVIYPRAEVVFVSPLIRCRETAKLIYPDIIPTICENFKECDFGEFENKNYKELSNNASYQLWIDSNGTLPFPRGEDPENFKKRCIQEFQKVVEISLKAGYQTIALVIHGGTIMSILDRFSYPKEDYYHWQTDNGRGYAADFDEKEGRMVNVCYIH